jgi:hypothetical protein
VGSHACGGVDTLGASVAARGLATPAIDDNRISYGCINVPVAFYENLIQPIFALSKAMVYGLPGIKPVHQVFGILQAASTGFDGDSSVPGHEQGGNGVVGDSGASLKR